MNCRLTYSASLKQRLARRGPRGRLSDVADRCTVVADEELIRRMAGGDSSALAEFYDRHAGQVFGFLLKILSVRVDAEDVLQDAFWQVWSQAGQFDAQRCSVRGWLYLLARSRGIDQLRRRRSHQDLDGQTQLVANVRPTGIMEQTESDQRLKWALERIPQEQASAIRLAFFNGLTHEEVATFLTIPLGTAKTRIRLGMLRLRDLLSEGSTG